MEDEAIFAPLCVFTLLVLIVWARLGFVRISGVFRGVIAPKYLRVGTGTEPPEAIVTVHHHYSNLFEVPVLFYLGCIGLFVTGSVDSVALWLAWSFVVLRAAHTAIVLTTNRPQVRVVPFVLSALAVWGLWLLLFYRVTWAGA